MTSFLPSLINPGLLVALVVFVHASFQAGVSVLTLLSGHSFRAGRAQSRVLRLNSSYIAGVVTLTLLLVTLFQQLAALILPGQSTVVWLILTIATLLVGIAITKAYYRRGRGTVLWLPRTIALFLTRRAMKTKDPVEAFSLGMLTVVAELPFSAVLFAIIGVLSHQLSYDYTIIVAFGYALVTALPLIILTILIGGGHRVSHIQRWREENKTFLQYSAGAGLLVAALFIIVFHLVGVTS